MTDQERERFARIFRLNVQRRSRTAKGKDEGSKTSSKKKPLLLQGDALKAQVAQNVETLITDVLQDAGSRVTFFADDIRSRCERWFDIANAGLYGPGAYAEEYAQVEADAKRLGVALDENLGANPRYRLWTPMYTTAQVAPPLLEYFMQKFYERLENELIGRDLDVPPEDVSEIMAVADVVMDGEIHPWMDGCGRVSTALVMWIGLVHGSEVPLFAPTKAAHYKDIRDVDAQAAYYLACFARAKAEPPPVPS